MVNLTRISNTPGSATTLPNGATTLNTWASQIETNAANIATNASNIAANAANIAANTAIIDALNTQIPAGLTRAQLVQAYTSANIVGQPAYTTAEGIQHQWSPSANEWLAIGSYVFLNSACPVGLPSSGTLGNNGALTLNTAFQTIYGPAGNIAGIYLYFFHAPVPNSPTGFYWVVMSSTTQGQIYNAFYTGGNPTPPVNPVALVGTGYGAYSTPTAAGISAILANVPNIMSITGGFEVEYVWNCFNSSTNKRLSVNYGGNAISNSYVVTTGQYSAANHTVRNQGVTGAQISLNSSLGEPATGTGIERITTDSTQIQAFGIGLQLDSASTDWMIIESCRGVVYPTMALDNYPTPAPPPAASATIVPPGAAAWGFTANKFFIAPTLAEIDFFYNQNGPLFTQLEYQYASQGPPTASTNFNPASGFAAMIGGYLCLYEGAIVTADPRLTQANIPNSPLGLCASSNGFYIEGCSRQSVNNDNNFSATWSLPIEHNGSPYQAGITTYAELDIDEGGLLKDTYNPSYNMRSTLISWVSGVGTDTTQYSGAVIDRTQWNVFGVAYVPANNKLYFYLNGNLIGSMSTVGVTINALHYYMILGWQSHVSRASGTWQTAPQAGAYGATLATPWPNASGQYPIFMPDANGEFRLASFQYQQTAVTWANPILSNPTTAFLYDPSPYQLFIAYLSAWGG